MADRIPPTKEIRSGFYLLSFGFVCSYLLRTGTSYIAFDTGLRPSAFISQVAALGIDPARIEHVLLTHSDRDHTGGLPALPHAAIYLSKDEERMFDHTTPRFFGMMHNRRPAKQYQTLGDGQRLLIGGATIRCISTPGHTAGSMSFLVNDSILIVGDELNLAEGRAVLDRGFISMDNASRLASIRKLAALDGVELLCPMHSGYTEEVPRAMSAWAIPRAHE